MAPRDFRRSLSPDIPNKKPGGMFTREDQLRGAAKGGATRAKDRLEAQEKYLKALSGGARHRDALKQADRAEATFTNWWREDPAFKRRLDLARRVGSGGMRYALYEEDFPTFCREVLKRP